MTKKTAATKRESASRHAIARGNKHGPALVESYLPAGSTERTVAGVASAALGALLLAALIGVGPAALAGAAGYVVYHETAR